MPSPAMPILNIQTPNLKENHQTLNFPTQTITQWQQRCKSISFTILRLYDHSKKLTPERVLRVQTNPTKNQYFLLTRISLSPTIYPILKVKKR
jgi:hypothetical protein